MKVTIIVPGRWHAFDLAYELNKLGILHQLITSYPKYKTRLWRIPDELVTSLSIQLLLEKFVARLFGEKWSMRTQYIVNNIFAQQAAKAIKNPHIVHTWSASAEPSLIKAKSIGSSTILERSSAHMLEQCRLLREEYTGLGLHWVETPVRTVERELREYQLADMIAVPSIFVQKSFLARGFQPDHLYRNGFGVNVSAFSPGIKRDSIFRIIYVGSLSVRKGIHYLVSAFKKANIPNSELLLIGGTTPETALLLGGHDSRILAVGHKSQSELANYYRQSTVFVMPSIEEGQAMVQFQAIACGLPLICTMNTGGEDLLGYNTVGARSPNSEIIDYPAGFVVPPRSDDALAECLCLLASNHELLIRKRNAASSIRDRDISWKRYAVAATQMYEQVLGSKITV